MRGLHARYCRRTFDKTLLQREMPPTTLSQAQLDTHQNATRKLPPQRRSRHLR